MSVIIVLIIIGVVIACTSVAVLLSAVNSIHTDRKLNKILELLKEKEK